MKLYRPIYQLGQWRSKPYFAKRYGVDFWRAYQNKSREILETVIAGTPDIGKGIFSFNYAFTPAYIAWYKAMLALGLPEGEATENIWRINERIMAILPGFIMPAVRRVYLGGFRKKAAEQERRFLEGHLHPYDYRIRYKPLEENCFQIDIYSCGMMRLCRDFDALGLFPSVCRMDYLFANRLGHGFWRSKTLGDGDDCCNCAYSMSGDCEWAPEKGFEDRK